MVPAGQLRSITSTVVVQGRQSVARSQTRSLLMTRQLDLTVQGVVGTNPVLSRVGDKVRPYCRFRVAVTPTYRTDQGWSNAETIWFTAKAWGRLAVNLSHSVRKGEAVLLTGRFSQESWENEGRKHETNVITLQAAGHDLTRGESRFARVRVSESAPSASSGAGAGPTESEAEYHASSDHWDTAILVDGSMPSAVRRIEPSAGLPESGRASSVGSESIITGPEFQEHEEQWSSYELADDLVEQATQIS